MKAKRSKKFLFSLIAVSGALALVAGCENGNPMAKFGVDQPQLPAAGRIAVYVASQGRIAPRVINPYRRRYRTRKSITPHSPLTDPRIKMSRNVASGMGGVLGVINITERVPGRTGTIISGGPVGIDMPQNRVGVCWRSKPVYVDFNPSGTTALVVCEDGEIDQVTFSPAGIPGLASRIEGARGFKKVVFAENGMYAVVGGDAGIVKILAKTGSVGGSIKAGAIGSEIYNDVGDFVLIEDGARRVNLDDFVVQNGELYAVGSDGQLRIYSLRSLISGEWDERTPAYTGNRYSALEMRGVLLSTLGSGPYRLAAADGDLVIMGMRGMLTGYSPDLRSTLTYGGRTNLSPKRVVSSRDGRVVYALYNSYIDAFDVELMEVGDGVLVPSPTYARSQRIETVRDAVFMSEWRDNMSAVISSSSEGNIIEKWGNKRGYLSTKFELTGASGGVAIAVRPYLRRVSNEKKEQKKKEASLKKTSLGSVLKIVD